MKLFLITHDQATPKWDYYDSAVVAAKDEHAARHTHPSEDNDRWNLNRGEWCEYPEMVTAQLLGTAIKGTKAGVICASFNAG